MFTLYYKPSCPYCRDVIKTTEELGVTLDLKNIGADEEMREKLLELGGKTQVPFLVDTVSGVMMYESADIITYLEKQVSGSSVNSVRIHKSVGTSKVCS